VTEDSAADSEDKSGDDDDSEDDSVSVAGDSDDDDSMLEDAEESDEFEENGIDLEYGMMFSRKGTNLKETKTRETQIFTSFTTR
jgi:hypothetical protein